MSLCPRFIRYLWYSDYNPSKSILTIPMSNIHSYSLCLGNKFSPSHTAARPCQILQGIRRGSWNRRSVSWRSTWLTWLCLRIGYDDPNYIKLFWSIPIIDVLFPLVGWFLGWLGCFPIGWDIIPIPNHHPKFFGPSSGMNLIISEVAKLSRGIYGPTNSYSLVATGTWLLWRSIYWE